MITKQRRVYNLIKRDIVDHRFAYESAISLPALQSDYAASTTAIREAVIALAAEDLLDFVPGRGFFAKEHYEREIIDTAALTAQLLIEALDHIERALAAKTVVIPSLHAIQKLWVRSDRSGFALSGPIAELVRSCCRQPHALMIEQLLPKCVMFLSVDDQGDPDAILRLVSGFVLLISRHSTETVALELVRLQKMLTDRAMEISLRLQARHRYRAAS